MQEEIQNQETISVADIHKLPKTGFNRLLVSGVACRDLSCFKREQLGTIYLPYRKFLLIDEKNPKLTLEASATSANFLNSRAVAKRSSWEKFMEVFSFGLFKRRLTLEFAEGSTITLMGLVRYDLVSREWKMTEVFETLYGGSKECSELLQKSIDDMDERAWYAILLASAFFTIAFFKVNDWWQERSYIKHM